MYNRDIVDQFFWSKSVLKYVCAYYSYEWRESIVSKGSSRLNDAIHDLHILMVDWSRRMSILAE
jgi:hypothetical protein